MKLVSAIKNRIFSGLYPVGVLTVQNEPEYSAAGSKYKSRHKTKKVAHISRSFTNFEHHESAT